MVPDITPPIINPIRARVVDNTGSLTTACTSAININTKPTLQPIAPMKSKASICCVNVLFILSSVSFFSFNIKVAISASIPPVYMLTYE